jgi:hypothetical protein
VTYAQASADVQQDYRTLQRTFANIVAMEVEDPVDNRKLYSQLPGTACSKQSNAMSTPMSRATKRVQSVLSCVLVGLHSDALKSNYLADIARLTTHLATTAVDHKLPRWQGPQLAQLVRLGVAVFNNVSFRQEQGTIVPKHVVAARIATAKGVAVKVRHSFLT